MLVLLRQADMSIWMVCFPAVSGSHVKSSYGNVRIILIIIIIAFMAIIIADGRLEVIKFSQKFSSYLSIFIISSHELPLQQ